MKKKALFSLMLLTLVIETIWVVEPVSLNPFSKIAIPKSASNVNFDCDLNPYRSHADFEQQANALVDERIKQGDFLGVAVGYYHERCGSYVSGAGFSSKRKQLPINSNTLMRSASITKPMTAIAIMQLYENGILDLDVPIQKYLKNFPVKAKGEITIRHLLKHTSGIPHYASKWEALSFSDYPTLNAATAIFNHKELEFTPGTQYLYSSYGYTILGAIIEEVTQMSYEEYMRKNVWEMAGMSDTGLEKSGYRYNNKSKLYLKIGTTYIKSPKTDLSNIYSAGGVQTTVGDLLKFGEAILQGKLVDHKTLKMMVNATDGLAPAIGDDPYGLGWAVYDHPKLGKIIQHGGSQPGASSFFAIFLDHSIVTTVLSNSFGSRQSAHSLSYQLAKLTLSPEEMQ